MQRTSCHSERLADLSKDHHPRNAIIKFPSNGLLAAALYADKPMRGDASNTRANACERLRTNLPGARTILKRVMSAAATLAGLARTQDYHRKSRAEKGFQDLSRSRFRPLYTLHGIRTGRSPPIAMSEVIQIPEREECSVCLEEYDKIPKATLLDCRHGSHKECLERWLKECLLNPTCPTCRGVVSEEKLFEILGYRPFRVAIEPWIPGRAAIDYAMGTMNGIVTIVMLYLIFKMLLQL
ncbi:hypothetical protein H4Q26_001791 [Puccinia striiformis f. sp. tritici PST-130]|nr:hypothetical protein H4Q26_001791 [Puccinia striiformis f. sp. tritici PST-130]